MNQSNLLKQWRKKKRSGDFKRSKAKEVKRMFEGQDGKSNNLRQVQAVTAVSDLDLSNQSHSSSVDCASCIFERTSLSAELFPIQDQSTSLNMSQIIQFDESNHSDPETPVNELKKFDKETFEADLVCWALQNKVMHTQLRGLLHILDNHFPQSELPHDPRTLLKTPRMIDIFADPQNDGERYWYYGLRRSMMNCLHAVNDIPSKISLIISTDGLPISNSSNEAFWPLLCTIYEMPQKKPLVIGIYHGKSNIHLFVLLFHQILFCVYFYLQRNQAI